MPSKGKKPSRAFPSAASVPYSPSPGTPSALAGGSGDDGGSDEGLLRQLLSEASAKYPAFISESAFCGRISESDSSLSNGKHSTIWLSEAAMVSSSLIPGSLVSVSLAALGKEPFNNLPLDNLAGEYTRHFGINVDNGTVNEAGCYFAIATVFPSRKVLKNGARLSWGLSCTMGFPCTGRAIFVSSINLSSSHHLIKSGSVPRIHVCECKDLYLNMVQQNSGVVTSTESVCAQNVNGNVASPKTPLYRSKLSSPSATPPPLRKIDSFSWWDTSSAMLALADEKFNDLLQTHAAWWICGRYLLNGNFATVPIEGRLCVFRVEGADNCSHDLLPHKIRTSDSLDEMNVALLVDTKTRLHLSGPINSVKKIPNEEDLPARNPVSTAIVNKGARDIPRLGGLSKEFAALKEIIMFSLANKNALLRYKGVLLHGPPGTGKTSLAASCAHDSGACLLSINGPELVSQYYGESEQALHEVFDLARRTAPAVVFIDELDAIAPARKDGGEELSLRMVATLLKLMDEINRADGILVIAATNRPDSIDPAMRRPGRLDKEIEIGVPSPDQRLEILHTLLSEMDHSLITTEIQSLALVTHGFVGADLAALCNEAAMTALRRHIKIKSSGKHFKEPCSVLDGIVADMQSCDVCKDEDMPSGDDLDSLSSSLSELTVSSKPMYPSSFQRVLEGVGTSGSYQSPGVEEEMLLKVTSDDFEKAKLKVRPSAMREVLLELPVVRWEDVGGQNKVKKQLIEAVQWPQINPDAFERIGIRPPRGLLMIGPPGCSKTLMARAVASEAKLNFLAVKGPELFSKWVGESEKAVRSLFAKARANSPAIIFFDEIDGLAITRGQENDGTSVADRVLSQLLVEMDGLDQRIGVTVIAATNRPDKIDHALLRPGRFDRLLDVQPPDESDREEIFGIHMRNMPCSSDVRTKDLACLTAGYTGADIQSVCRAAAFAALDESLDISEVSMRHFKIGIGNVLPSDIQFYQDLAAQFRRIVDTGSASNV